MSISHGCRGQRVGTILLTLAKVLTQEFGKGFDASNLHYMRLFYQAFPICDALRHELSWTHYRTLFKVDSDSACAWYMNEADEHSRRDRQVRTKIKPSVNA